MDNLPVKLLRYVEYIASLLGGTLALIAGVYAALGKPSEGQVQGFTLAIVSTLIIAQVSRSISRQAERREISSMQAALEEVIQTVRTETNLVMQLLGTGISLVKCPEDARAYIELWSGFEGNYFAYNPSYRIDNFPGVNRTDIIREVFVARYENKRFDKASYLFLTGDHLGKKDLDDFKKLMKEAKEMAPDIGTKLEVRERKDLKASGDSESYLGTKNGVKTAILEPKEPPLTRGRGMPYSYFAVTNPQVYNDLYNHFLIEWEKKDARGQRLAVSVEI